MKIVTLNLAEIKPYVNNPRKNDKAVAVVAKSIEQYGFQQPIVVDKNSVIVAGHTRYRAARQLGLKQVPVVVADNLSQEQINAYRIMDNRSNENAHWDDSLLYTELKTLLADSTIQDLSIQTGFTESELNKLFQDSEENISLNIETQYKSQIGDLWQLGDNLLLNGDSTDQKHINTLLGTDAIDLIWEDPPYGVSYETVNGINYTKEQNEQRNHKIKNDDMTAEQLDQFLDQHLSVVAPKLKSGGVVYWSHDIRFTQQFRDLLTKYNIHISDTLIWRKNTLSSFLSDYSKWYEPILYGWKEGAEHAWYGKGSPPNSFSIEELEDMTKEQLIKLIKQLDTNYQEFNKESRKIASLHPTVKPVKLIVYHIINSSKVNDIVYDGFSGSGSTLIACERTQRRARCIELEPKFVDATIQRWQDETGLQARRQDGVLWDDVNSIAGDLDLQQAFLNSELSYE